VKRFFSSSDHGVALWVQHTLAVFLACTLIFSFGLHTLDTNHIHPGQVPEHHHHHDAGHTDTIAEYVHGGEKKFFLVLLSFFAYACVVFSFRKRESLTVFFVISLRRIHAYLSTHRVHQWEVQLFSNGILHPKLF
jgi:hypothetical protein